MRSQSLRSIVAGGAVQHLDARGQPPEAAARVRAPTPLYRVPPRAGLPSFGGIGWG